ncbi:hypothetical protein WICPIJ_008554 [Wickerhamomyces pijperi]|uniref:Minichromosome loss protein Mcl1 middle region domain-containing protein n=1 Tax=Wickerhamomyces pijperi TaxID=599730 RepID=A0A9P8PY35_WICPI|nr:hypothetical protein WICPIJ_008554 [Wickerhamomyces pijperi]
MKDALKDQTNPVLTQIYSKLLPIPTDQISPAMSGKEEIRQIFTTGGKTIVKFNSLTRGSTALSSTKLIVASNRQNLVKVYDLTDDTKEPDIVDTIDDTTFVLPLANSSKFIVASVSGEVKLFSSKNTKEVITLHRSLLPVRNVVLSHDARKIVVSGDDNEVCVVDLEDPTNIVKLPVKEQVHGCGYSLKLNLLTLSLANGDVEIYDCMTAQPELIQTISGEIARLIYQDGEDNEDEEDNILTTSITWNPMNEEFAVPCSSKLIKVFSRTASGEFHQSHSFPALHQDKLVDLQYDNTGQYLASLDLQGKLIIWDTNKREAVYDKQFGSQRKLRSVSWGVGSTPELLSLACGAEEGQILMLHDVVQVSVSSGSLKNSSSSANKKVRSEMEDILAMDQANELDAAEDEEEADDINLDSELSGDENDGGEDLRGFINDGADDDADEEDGMRGYGLESDAIDQDDYAQEEGLFVGTSRKRRPATAAAAVASSTFSKRSRSSAATSNYNFSPAYEHKPYSQGCTPFGNTNKRFLTMNSIGHVHTVKHEETATSSVSVSFFDKSENRDYHFDDHENFDMASLSSDGLFLGLSNKRVVTTKTTNMDDFLDDNEEEHEQEEKEPVTEDVVSYEGLVTFRTHSNDHSAQWSKRIPLSSKEEIITTVAVSSNLCLVGTSLGYLRYFSIEGIPLHYERTLPLVASAVNETHIFTIMLQSGPSSFVYSMFTMDRECLQRELAIPISKPIKSLFFSSHGTPTLATQDNVIISLANYTAALQAHWVPILNCENAIKEMTKGRQVKGIYAWPLGLHYDEVMCLVSRNSEEYPVAPLPLPDTLKCQLEISLPSKQEEEAKEEELDQGKDSQPVHSNEEMLLKSRVFGEILNSGLTQHGELFETDQDTLQQYASSIERSVLVLYSKACAEGEINRAWALVMYLRELNTVRLALKMAERIDNRELQEKIRQLIDAKEREELEQEENIFSD